MSIHKLVLCPFSTLLEGVTDMTASVNATHPSEDNHLYYAADFCDPVGCNEFHKITDKSMGLETL